MKPMNATEALVHFDVGQLHEWLAGGMRKMCGLESGFDDAFAPIAHRVGASREQGWLDDLAELALTAEDAFRKRFVSALNQTLSEFADALNADTWVLAQSAVDLMRRVGVEHCAMGLQRLAARLQDEPSPLPDKVRQTLVSAAILALTETRGADRHAAKPLVLALMPLSLRLHGRLTEQQSTALRQRLHKLKVPWSEMQRLGVAPEGSPAVDEIAMRRRFLGGPVHG